MKIGGRIGYWILRRIAPGGGDSGQMDGSAYSGKSKLRVLLGAEALSELGGKSVLDFGCGFGSECLELLEYGATHVVGLDIQEQHLDVARARAVAFGKADQCTFVSEFHDQVDAIVSIDSFEHFEDPAEVLGAMHSMLKPGGKVHISFGPTWYHPLGGHLFSGHTPVDVHGCFAATIV